MAGALTAPPLGAAVGCAGGGSVGSCVGGGSVGTGVDVASLPHAVTSNKARNRPNVNSKAFLILLSLDT
jgi:hypothetical protein